MITVLKSKISEIKITGLKSDYEGSLTLCPELMERANIKEYEQIYINSKYGKGRIMTYVLKGEINDCELNGGACNHFEVEEIVHLLVFKQIPDNDYYRPIILKNWRFTDAIKYYNANPYKNYDYDIYIDKHKVKDFVKDIINVAKEYAYFTKPKEIDKYDFVLPDSFVIKGVHGAGWTIFVKNNFNKKESIIKMKSWLGLCYTKLQKSHLNLTHGVLIEEYLNDIQDYKFFMFNGKLEFILFNIGYPPIKQNYYDKDWNLIPMSVIYPIDIDIKYEKPDNLEEMIRVICELTRKIKNPPFVRVDIYRKNNELYFGEYTFSPFGGSYPFVPNEYEEKYGSFIIKDKNYNE